jgi:ketosteroid isomerase-like protein
MASLPDPLAADQEFFSALMSADPDALQDVLADDFTLIDVVNGGEIFRSTLIDLVLTGQLRFENIEAADSRARVYGEVTVVTGTTRMHVHAGPDATTIRSRYTHVFVIQGGRWRMVAAQGTRMGADA